MQFQQVTGLVNSLREHYGSNLWSAASKFLWLRYKSPVTIYDQLAYQGLKNLMGSKRELGYEEYARSWRKNYEDNKLAIAKACTSLIDYIRFTAGSGWISLI